MLATTGTLLTPIKKKWTKTNLCHLTTDSRISSLTSVTNKHLHHLQKQSETRSVSFTQTVSLYIPSYSCIHIFDSFLLFGRKFSKSLTYFEILQQRIQAPFISPPHSMHELINRWHQSSHLLLAFQSVGFHLFFWGLYCTLEKRTFFHLVHRKFRPITNFRKRSNIETSVLFNNIPVPSSQVKICRHCVTYSLTRGLQVSSLQDFSLLYLSLLVLQTTSLSKAMFVLTLSARPTPGEPQPCHPHPSLRRRSWSITCDTIISLTLHSSSLSLFLLYFHRQLFHKIWPILPHLYEPYSSWSYFWYVCPPPPHLFLPTLVNGSFSLFTHFPFYIHCAFFLITEHGHTYSVVYIKSKSWTREVIFLPRWQCQLCLWQCHSWRISPPSVIKHEQSRSGRSFISHV